MAKNQSKTKQDPEAELLLFQNYWLSSFMLSSKPNMIYYKKYAKNKCIYFNEIMWIIVMKMKLKMKNVSHRSDINRTSPRHGYEYTKYKMCPNYNDGYVQ